MDICLMRRKSGSFEIIRKVFKNEVEVIVTRNYVSTIRLRKEKFELQV